MDFLRSYEGQAYALMRIVVGFLFLFHGGQKILGWFGGPPDMPPAMLYTAGIIELVGGLMVMVGLMGSLAAFLCSGLMAAAYFMVHQGQGALPIQNQGELAVLYCWVFLFIAARGSGIWSVDAARGAS